MFVKSINFRFECCLKGIDADALSRPMNARAAAFRLDYRPVRGTRAMLHSRLLKYLDEVARLGSIRKASARLNVASSAINRQILALENELGAPIFERMPRRLR